MTKLLQPLLKHLPSQASQQAQTLIQAPPVPLHALHLHERRLLGPLVQLLRHKDDAVRHQSLYVLLECVRSSPLGMAELVDTPNCMQALVHVLTAGVQGPASAQAVAVTAAHVLWNLSSDVGVRALMHKHTPSLGKVFFGLLDHASVHMRAAGSGALYNLASSIGQVARELPCNTQLVAFLVSMLGKDKDWRQMPRAGQQPVDLQQQHQQQQQQQQQQDLMQGRLGRLYIDANWSGGRPQQDMAFESEVLVEAHAAGLLSILVQSNAQAQLLLSLEGGIEQVLLGLQVTASSPNLLHASAQLRDTCGRVLMGLLCHASTRISTTTSHMLLTHAVCLESEAAQLVCGNASIRRGMADALAAAALALGVSKQEVATSLLSTAPQGAPDPPLIRASFEVSTDGESAVSGDTLAEGKAAALQQPHVRGGKEECGPELGVGKRWQALEAKVQGSDPLERLQVGQDVMYMLHVLVADEECARALAATDYGIVHMLRLMAYLDVNNAPRSATPALSTTSNKSNASAPPPASGASRQGTELGMANAGSQQALQKLAASMEAVRDDQVLTGVQALAAGTLAHLADFEAIRQLPSMQQALSPEPNQLTALAVLMLPHSEPSKPALSTTSAHKNGQGSMMGPQLRDKPTDSAASNAEGSTPSERKPALQPNPVCVQGVHLQGMLAMLLAAVAQHGPFAYATFTSVLLQAPGSLGVILSLLPSPKDRAVPQAQAKWPPSAPLSTRSRPLSSSSVSGSSIDAGLGARLQGNDTDDGMKPVSGVEERDRATGFKRNSVPDLWVSDYQLALSRLTCPRLDMGQPWVVSKPASMMAALKLCCVAAAGSRDVAWVLASKTTLVPSAMLLLTGKSQVMDLWHYSGLSPAGWQHSLQHWGLGVLKALVTSLDDVQAYDQVASKADLVPTLLCSLHSPSPMVCVDALELLEALLGHTMCSQVLEDSSHSSKLVVQLMLMAGLLEPVNSSDSLGGVLHGSHAPIRLQAACLANRRKANTPNKGTKLGHRAQASATQLQEQACVASVAASVLHLMAASAEPPYNVTLGHLAGVPHAMEALVEQIGLLATKLATPVVRALDDEVDQLRHLTGLAAEACLKGVMPPLLPHPPPCPLLDITQHTARLQTSSGRSPNHDGQRPTRTGTSSARHGSSHARVGSVLPGPAGDALRSLAHVASALDVVSESAGALLHAVNHEGVVELMPQVFSVGDERNSNQHMLWPEILSARAAGTGHTPGLSRMPSGWSAGQSADHPSVGPSPLGLQPHNAIADASVAPTHFRPPRAALESICHDSLVILHRLLMFWSLESPTILASCLEGVHRCLYQGTPLRGDSLGRDRDPGQDGSQGGSNGVGFPLPPPFGSNPTRRLAFIAEICGEGLVRTSSVAVQRAAAHCLNATVALHQDLAKFILATLPKVRSNALDVMMAAVVRMGGGDSGATQEHRVELALAALAAASGSANLKRTSGATTRSLVLPPSQQRQRQQHISGTCSGMQKFPGGADRAQLKGNKVPGGADAEDPENPLLDDLMSYAEVMVASFDAVRRLLLAAPRDKTGLLRPALVKEAGDPSQQYYLFSRQGANGGGVGSRATPQQGIQKRRYVREVLANNNKPYGSMDASADPRALHSISYTGVPATHLHAWREDWSWGLQDLGGASDVGIGEEQLAQALDLMLEEDTLSQLQAMLEAVWAQQKDAWALCVGQLRRALDHHNQQLKPPVETRRLPQNESFKGKPKGNQKQPPGTSGASQAASQQHNHGGRGFYKCNSWDGFRLEVEDSAGWARISDALQRVAGASAAAAANVPPDLRLVAAEVVVAAAPLAHKPLVGKAGGLLRGLGSVLAEPFSGAGSGTGTASNPNPPVTLAATHMTAEGSSGRSMGDALVLRLQERQQKVLVLQALWSLSRTPGGPQAISVSGAAAALAAPSTTRSRRSSPANHMAPNNAVSATHGHGNASSNSSGSQGGGAKASVGVPVLPGLVMLIVQVQDHGLKAHAAGVIAAVSCHLDPTLLSTIGGTAGLAAGLVAVVTNLVPVLTKALFTANGVRTPSPSSYAGPTHSPPPLPRTASPGMGPAYGPEGPDFNTIEAQALACIMALAALAELCRSAPVAARVATLKGLPAALAAALRIHSMDMCLYAAGLAGNLLNHTASQSATITAARGTLSKDLVKCLKVFCTAPHPLSTAPSAPSTSPASQAQQPTTEGPHAAGASFPGYPATAPGGASVGNSAVQGAHTNVPQPSSGSSQESSGSSPASLEPVDKQEALVLLLGALRNLASCEQGRAEMANDSATVPLLLCILRQEPWQIARPNQSKARTLKERPYDVNMGPVMEQPYRPPVPSAAALGEPAGTAARGQVGEGGAAALGPRGAHGDPTCSPPRTMRTEAGLGRAGTAAEAGEGGMAAGEQQHVGSRGAKQQLEPMYRPHIQVLAASVLANLSVDRTSQEAFVADADLVIRALLDVLSCAVTLPSRSPSSSVPSSTSPSSTPQVSNIRRPSKMSPMSALQESMIKGPSSLHDRGRIAHNRAPSDGFTRGTPGLVTSASGGLAMSASGVQSSAVQLSLDSIAADGQLAGSRRMPVGGAESSTHSSIPALAPSNGAYSSPFGNGHSTAALGHPVVKEAGAAAAAGSGTAAVIPIPENPAEEAQLQCCVAVALSNAMSHSVLARAALTHVRTVPLLCALIMRIPCPGEILEAASASPHSLHSLRQTLEGWGRLVSVAALRALQQLLSSVGPRALQQLRAPKPGEALPTSVRSHSKLPSMVPGSTAKEGPLPGSATAAAQQASLGVAGISVAGLPPTPTLKQLLDKTITLLDWVNYYDLEGSETAGVGADGRPSSQQNNCTTAAAGPGLAGAAAALMGACACYSIPMEYEAYVAPALPCLVRLVQLPIMQHISQAMNHPPAGAAVPMLPRPPQMGAAAAGGGGVNPLECAAAHATAALWALVSNPACAPWAVKVAADADAVDSMLAHCAWGQYAGSGAGGTRARFSAHRLFSAATLGHLAVLRGHTVPTCLRLLHALLLQDGPTAHGVVGALVDLATLAIPQASQEGGSSGAARQQQQQQQQQRRGAPRPGRGRPGPQDIERGARGDALALVGAPQDVACMLGLQAAGTLSCLASSSTRVACTSLAWPGVQPVMLALLRSGHQDSKLAGVTLVGALAGPGIGMLTAGTAGAAAAETAGAQGSSAGVAYAATTEGSLAEGAESGAQGADADTGKRGQGLQGKERAASPTAGAGGAQPPSTLPSARAFVVTDAPEHADGAQAARWALLGYGKDGSKPSAGSLGVDPIKGVPEKGAELLHTLLSTCMGGCIPAGAASPAMWAGKEEALVVASAAVAVADLALEEDVAVLLATANMRNNGGESAAAGIAGVNRAKPPLARPEGRDARQRAAGGEAGTGAPTDAAAGPHVPTAQAGPLQPLATNLQQLASSQPGTSGAGHAVAAPPPGPLAIVDVLLRLLMVPFNMLQHQQQQQQQLQQQQQQQQQQPHVFDYSRAHQHNVAYLSNEPGRGGPLMPRAAGDQVPGTPAMDLPVTVRAEAMKSLHNWPPLGASQLLPGGPSSGSSSRQHAQHEQQGMEHGISNSSSSSLAGTPAKPHGLDGLPPHFNLSLANQSLLKKRQQLEAQRVLEAAAKSQADLQLAAVAAAAAAGALQNVLSWPIACNALLSHPSVLACVEKALLALPALQHHALTPPAIQPSKAPSTALQTHHITLATLGCCLLGCVANFAALEEGRNKVLLRHPILEVLVTSLGEGSPSDPNLSPPPAPQPIRGSAPLLKGPPLPSTTADGKASTANKANLKTPADTPGPPKDADTHEQQSTRQQVQQQQQQQASVALGAISNLLMLMPSGDGLQLGPPGPVTTSPTSAAAANRKGADPLLSKGAAAAHSMITGWHPMPTIPHYIPDQQQQQQQQQQQEGRLVPGGAGEALRPGADTTTPPATAAATSTAPLPPPPSLQAARTVPKPPSPASMARAAALASRAREGEAAEGPTGDSAGAVRVPEGDPRAAEGLQAQQQGQTLQPPLLCGKDRTLGGQYKGSEARSGRSVLLSLMRQRQEVPGTLRTLSLAPRHSPAAQKPPPTQPSSSPAPVAPNSAAFSTPRQQHATQSHRVPPPQPLVVPMVGSVSMPTRQMQTSSEDAHGSGRGGWGEAIREVAHMAAWVMRQMDSSSHGRP